MQSDLILLTCQYDMELHGDFRHVRANSGRCLTVKSKKARSDALALSCKKELKNGIGTRKVVGLSVTGGAVRDGFSWGPPLLLRARNV